ncbi:MAG: hypothetical protein A3D20_07130 [Nitrospinae bacterium RIFCSPHIGHO2_02_FULL_39_82]|nr:MAG: hypothetical protein A3D20_07130 [Nitrospinae bacterium RIFCSPHIGHO2_02_FULL_39_82]OGW11595.1 MAG: hypothetical protein A3F81_05830 [Nitrospinae bacterium RIFCSPLOWO2_12_FULL_39_93]
MNIYLDNAATSFPKPETVYRAVNDTLQKYGSSPGRGGHKMSMQTERIIFEARERITSFFNIPFSSNVIFTFNVTMGINLALKGILKAGDHVITSSMEHNAVMRPLKRLENEGVSKTVVKCSKEGFLNPKDIEKEIKPNTKMIVITHASNVTGTILPIREVGEIARKNGIIFFVDAAQSAGLLPIDVQKDNIDILGCTGHKSLFGPQGTGFLYIKDGLDVKPLIEGGTGSNSESDEMPDFLPDKFQAGTLNTPGIAGLGAGIEFIQNEGLEKIRDKELHLATEILNGLKKIKGVTLYGPSNSMDRVSVISFNIDGKDPAEVGNILNEKYDIMSRVGLHCSPNAHRTIGTFPEGTVRVSVGYFNTEDDIDKLIKAVRDIRDSKVVLEILKQAMESEQDGYEFYIRASAMTKDPKGKAMFKYLARDETDHFKTLEEAYNRLKGGEGKGSKTIGHKKKEKGFVIDSSLQGKLKDDSGDLKALNIALKIEEDAQEFYTKSAEKAKQFDVRDMLLNLADMEKNHYKLLKYEYDFLTHSGFWCDFSEITIEETE